MSTQDTIAIDYSPALLVIPVSCAGTRLDAALASLLPQHSRSRLQAWLKAERITVDGLPADAKRKVFGGEVIRLDVEMPAEASAHRAEDIPLSVVYEDAELLIIDKPAGLVVHPGSGNWSGTMMNALLHHAPQLAQVPRAGIVHRLDKDTSGLLVVAKTLAAQTDLVRQLQARTVKRHYRALVHGKIERCGTVDAPIGRHPVQRTRMAIVARGATGGGGRDARTHYTPAEHFTGATLVDCQLETGRTHQIRVHMASIGHPLVGDPVYGKRRCGIDLLDAFPRQALHAARLALLHPASGNLVEWSAPLPADFVDLLAACRRG